MVEDASLKVPNLKEDTKSAIKQYKESCTEENRQILLKLKEAANTKISNLKSIK